jgi:alpha-ketoglutarate-dependent taurine dioxygenase
MAATIWFISECQGSTMISIYLSKWSDKNNPFDVENTEAYRAWRELKLNNYPVTLEELLVEVKDPRSLTAIEYKALIRSCGKTNMALYRSKTAGDADKNIPLRLARQLGLNNLDRNWLADKEGVTSLTVRSTGERSHYIPYTNKPINWHTDGYYNPAHRQIYSLLLHCVSSAAQGGENALLDHEIAYIMIRDENPEYIRALMARDVMTIPARISEDGSARPDETGPVFFIHPISGDLHMRYTARTRSILWKDDALTRKAVGFLSKLLASDLKYIFRGRLEPGMGLVSNNVLHDRTGFKDDADHQRLLYRARFYNRIWDTGVREIYQR